MNIAEVGKYFQIPINDFRIYGFDFTRFIRIEFSDNPKDEWNYELEIWGTYQIRRYGKEY